MRDLSCATKEDIENYRIKNMNTEKLLSKCCNAKIKAECADEGTCCYVCQNCKAGCDFYDSTTKQNAKGRKLLKQETK